MVNEGSAGFNDDEDLIVVAVDEPVEMHFKCSLITINPSLWL